MQTITQDLASNQGVSNRIELLDAARIALEAEAEGIDNDAFCEEHSAILDALSFERPKTAGEIGIMLHAAGFHMDMLMNGVEEEESAPARRARGEKVERILTAVRGAFPMAAQNLKSGDAN
jgi:hypothetical protein